MNRDELQEKAWQAWLSAPSARHGVNAAVEVAEPIIRADERHFLHSRGLRSVARVERDLADLRAKVEGLRAEARSTERINSYTRVLALLDEEKP